MGGTGTVGMADLYGTPSRPGGRFDPLSVQNPNGGSVAPVTQTASGGASSVGNGPALSVLGLVLALVSLRVFIGLAQDA